MKTGLLAGLFSVLFSATVFAAPVLKLNSSGRDVMLDAPGILDPAQLDELQLMVRPKPEA